MILDGAGKPHFCAYAIINGEHQLQSSQILRDLDAASIEVYRRLIQQAKSSHPDADLKTILTHYITRNQVEDLFATTIVAANIIQPHDTGRIIIYSPGNEDNFVFFYHINKAYDDVLNHVHERSNYYKIAYYANERLLCNIPSYSLPENLKLSWEEICMDSPPTRRRQSQRRH